MAIFVCCGVAAALYIAIKPTLDTIREDELEHEEKRMKNSHRA